MIDCNITKNYFSEKKRMLKVTNSRVCQVQCKECPLGSRNNVAGMCCTDFEMLYPKEAIEIVQRWSDEHPPKTYLSEFLKHYPNAMLNDDGIPELFCPYHLGLMSKDNCTKECNCIECWNQHIEDGEE